MFKFKKYFITKSIKFTTNAIKKSANVNDKYKKDVRLVFE